MLSVQLSRSAASLRKALLWSWVAQLAPQRHHMQSARLIFASILLCNRPSASRGSHLFCAHARLAALQDRALVLFPELCRRAKHARVAEVDHGIELHAVTQKRRMMCLRNIPPQAATRSMRSQAWRPMRQAGA